MMESSFLRKEMSYLRENGAVLNRHISNLLIWEKAEENRHGLDQ